MLPLGSEFIAAWTVDSFLFFQKYSSFYIYKKRQGVGYRGGGHQRAISKHIQTLYIYIRYELLLVAVI